MSKITLILSTLLLFIAIPASAQVTVSLGTYSGAGSTNSLLSTSTTSNRYSRTISLYTDTEIITAGGTAGIISKLGWDKSGTGEYTTADAYIKIYLKHVTNDTWTSIPDWNTEIVGATEVFTSSTYSIPTGIGWIEVPFTNTFTWNGTDNIAVMVEWDRSSAPTADIKWGYSNTPLANATRVGSASLNALVFLINDKRPLLQLTIASGASCAAPANIKLDNTTSNTADISWDASPDETGGYAWELYESGDTQGVDPSVSSGTLGTSITSVSVSSLADNTAYDFYVETICSGGTSGFAGPMTFITLEDCEAPTSIILDAITETTASISWTASLSEVNGYEWELYNAGDIRGTDPTVTAGNVATGITTLDITSLTSDTSYDFYIRTMCTNLFSDYEGPFNFRTDEELNVSANIIEGLTLYPNPVEDLINISAKTILDKVEMFTINGQKINEINTKENSLSMDISGFPQGLYFLRISSEDKISNFKIVKK